MNSAKDTEDVVGVICVDRKGRVLLVQGKGGKWSFPKGRSKENDSHYQGAIREAKEEAGIELADRKVNVKLKLRYGTYYVYAFGRAGEEIPLDEPMTQDEITKVEWVNLNSQVFEKEEKSAALRVYLSRT